VLHVKLYKWNEGYVLWDEDHEEFSSSDESVSHDYLIPEY